MAVDRQRHAQRATGGVAANQLHAVVIHLFEQAIAERLEPLFVHFRQRQRQRKPRGIGAHCCQVAQVNRQGFIAEIGGIDIRQEVNTRNQGIGTDG
ncbi:hypothetical protein D3C80_1448880 [compost metagenome]